MRQTNKKCSCGRRATQSLIVLASTSNLSPRRQANSAAIRFCDRCGSEVEKTLGRLKAASPATRVLKGYREACRGLQDKLAALAQGENAA
jgi:hypothetical protein